eukprot:TRINITY_DN10446_c0_g1_i7.p1 TRINITY_DN10446_c0_g1~~TRINITY_DN10446_c0_g1_i7.p1  ORF type:complete len:172 (+),score=29.13 TRINITY_DN10446_c0_g1_i7:201-716(+)
MIVDGTDCPIQAPSDKKTKIGFCSYRNKDNQYSHYNLKYTVAVQIGNGKICSILGPDVGKNALSNGSKILVFWVHKDGFHVLWRNNMWFFNVCCRQIYLSIGFQCGQQQIFPKKKITCFNIQQRDNKFPSLQSNHLSPSGTCFCTLQVLFDDKILSGQEIVPEGIIQEHCA